MKPKDKARELVNRFKDFTKQESYERKNYNAIECALIAVDEIINEIDNKFLQRYDAVDRYFYWKEVKQEINKL